MPRQRSTARRPTTLEKPAPERTDAIVPAVTLPTAKKKRSVGPRFFNRELSWLEFNRRVLDEACDRNLPVLERLKFLAITASNLDEFFMVRVGSLRRQISLGLGAKQDPSGMTAVEQLQAIGRVVRRFVADQYALLADELEPGLARAGIHRYPIERLTHDHLDHLERVFEQEIFPVITPMAISSPAEFPLLPGLGLNLIVRLMSPKGSKQPFRFALIPLPRSLPRFVTLPGEIGYQFVLLEEVILLHLERLFPGEPICESIPFRITRNADLALAEDDVDNFLEEMEEVLDARRQSPCIRLEIDRRCPGSTLSFLKESLQLQDEQIYHMTGPLQLGSFMILAGTAGFDEYKVESWTPQPSPDFPTGVSVFDVIAQRDVLLFHPMQSYDPVVQFIEEAADDPDVLAIKGILYRTSARSPIVGALARAAACDKHVTVLVELKARFDEARNIEWARELERAGVQVIYGIKGLKTHAKCFIVVRREADGIRRYIHFGTGNYNESTARVYADVSLFTAADDFGLDASQFFNAITGYSQPLQYRQISAAPLGLRDRLLSLINSEAERSSQGQEARIIAKMNSLVDPEIIEALYAASKAGVKINLNVRGICCLRPGVKGLSENITMVSIIDRFLEHARLAYFHQGGDGVVFLSSADWMPRNLDRRIELLVPVNAQGPRDRIMHILEAAFRDNVQARQLQPDGTYRRLTPAPGTEPYRSQEELYKFAKRLARQDRQDRRGVFEPQRAKKRT